MNIRTALIALATVAATAPLMAHAACTDTFANGSCIYGEAVGSAANVRTVDVATARNIDAAYGETIRFVDGPNAFSWTFDGLAERSVPLARIAPSGIRTDKVTVYVGAGPQSKN